MLNPTQLKSDLEQLFHDVLPSAIQVCMRSTFTEKTTETDELCKNFAKKFDEMTSSQLAERMADIIDKYIKSMGIYGTIITAGTPVTQTAPINPGGMVNVRNPIAGKVPNILGVM